MPEPRNYQDARGDPELILLMKPEAAVEFTETGARSSANADVGRLDQIASESEIRIRPLFGVDEARLRGQADLTPLPGETPEQMNETLDRMARFFHVEAPPDRLEDLARELRELEAVETAYVKPAAELAHTVEEEKVAINDMAPTGLDAPPVTPDFVARQGYLDAAPTGVDARYAWTQPGGRGGGVRVIDCEWGWRFTHEDLLQNQGGIVSGTGSTDTNHGTAVIGEISGDINTYGVTGIAPNAVISAAAFSQPSATAIRAAADRLGLGDIILLEIHRPGPNSGGGGQQGFVAIEWWPDDYLAIRYAVNKGIVVVEAAGNGAENLDAAAYDTPAPGFPSWWRNPFRRNPLDSGAVIVGAGAPPPGTHGRDHGPDRSRLGFSNFGSCVDAQGWGREVTTAGYGDLQAGPNPDFWYTDSFSGTSSASPIVVGAIACVQGVLRAHGRTPLSPSRARQLLRSTGSPQQDAPGRPATQRIGTRPNLRQLIPNALQTSTWVGVQFRGQLPARATQRWFTFNWPAHWHVVWTVMPTSPRPGAPQLKWRVRVERANDQYATYWIDVISVVDAPVDFEARYAVLGW